MRRSAALVLSLLAAGNAHAWNDHSLTANAAGAQDPMENDLDVSVDALNQVGLPGVTPSSFFAHAAANSDSGIVLAESSVDRGEGEQYVAGYTVANIEEWLLLEDAGNPVTVAFLLTTALAAQKVGAGRSQAAARLDVTTLCSVYVQVFAIGDPEVVDNCTESYPDLEFAAHAGPDAITVTATFAAGHVPEVVDFLVQVENDIDMGFTGGDTAQAFASGALSIEVAGAAGHSFTSPTFLTVPEPGFCALALSALGSLAISDKRRA